MVSFLGEVDLRVLDFTYFLDWGLHLNQLRFLWLDFDGNVYKRPGFFWVWGRSGKRLVETFSKGSLASLTSSPEPLYLTKTESRLSSCYRSSTRGMSKRSGICISTKGRSRAIYHPLLRVYLFWGCRQLLVLSLGYLWIGLRSAFQPWDMVFSFLKLTHPWLHWLHGPLASAI